MSKVFDIFTFNNEKEILDIHLNVLKPHVDRFIIVEFDKTFSGKPKPRYFEKIADKYKDFNYKYVVFDESYYEKYRELAESSPNTVGADHWKREFMQKECLKDALEDCKGDDIVLIGDCDEIWSPEILDNWFAVSKLKLKVYSYRLNNRSSEEFWGTIVSTWGELEKYCLNDLRQKAHFKTETDMGWHFTSMGGYDAVKRKLSDSYTEESYWNPEVQALLAENLANNKDILGRDFTYTIDESEWPEWLKQNKERYKHLLR